MGFAEIAYLAWPWIGLGGAIVLFVILFATDWFRSRTDVGRWRDPAWLAWLAVPVYLVHVFEEYGLHVTGGQFDLVTAFERSGVMEMFGGDFNLLVFPEVNMLLVYVAFPIAAWLGRKNPVIGLMSYGFMLVNGLTHIAGTLRFGGGLLSQPGNITGLFCFIPLFMWFVYATVKGDFMDGKGLVCAIVAGVVQHLGVFSVYGVNLAVGPTAAVIWVPFMCCLGIVVAWLLAKAVKPKLATN
ncbi:MAG: HXXEE domain-containing protein [Eggerthellaceae bacterium]|nr:HXXEE domain-containing protein [Eggerthellaceae bacterium]